MPVETLPGAQKLIEPAGGVVTGDAGLLLLMKTHPFDCNVLGLSSNPSVRLVSWPYPVSVENAPTTTLNNPKTKFFRIIRAPVYHSRPEILAPQFTLARFNRSLAGLRLSTDPELPGASPIVLGMSIPTSPVTVFLQRHVRAAAVFVWPGMRMRSVRWEQNAAEGAEDEARIEA